MHDIINRVRSFILENNLIEENDVVGCGLSGGADSILMTYILNKLSRDMNFKVMGIHINHMLRGDESYRDEDFSRKFCEDNDIEFMSFTYDILNYSKENKVSIEMAGRDIRYNLFSKIKNDGVITKCALAHHSDDDVETIIMRIFNGTGIEGLQGIKPMRDNFYIRPVLFLRRKEDIERTLNENNISFIIDKSNLEEDYLRNKIRLSIIPKINESFGKDITNSILGLKEISTYDSGFLNDMVKSYMDKYVKIYDDYLTIDKEAFKLHKSILYRLIRSSILILNGNISNISLSHIKYIGNVINIKENKTLNIKKDLYCKNTGSYIKVFRYLEPQVSYDHLDITLLDSNDIYKLKNGDLKKVIREIDFFDQKFKFILEYDEDENRNVTMRYEKYFSLDGVNTSISIRNRRQGDMFMPFGMNKEKKLKDFFINEKVKDRDKVPLICFDDKIVWIFGLRNSNHHKVVNNTKIVKIKLERIGD